MEYLQISLSWCLDDSGVNGLCYQNGAVVLMTHSSSPDVLDASYLPITW